VCETIKSSLENVVVEMNRKVILERDDPRRLSATIAPIPSPPTAASIA
jgi:hypothetical protein